MSPRLLCNMPSPDQDGAKQGEGDSLRMDMFFFFGVGFGYFYRPVSLKVVQSPKLQVEATQLAAITCFGSGGRTGKCAVKDKEPYCLAAFKGIMVNISLVYLLGMTLKWAS